MAITTAGMRGMRFGEVIGVWALILEGGFSSLLLVFSRGLQGAGWPYYRFNGVVFITIGTTLFLYRAARCTLSKRWLIWKWLLLRGLFGASTYVCFVFAAPLAPIGDLVALGTINIVVAAMIGQIFLKEKLRVQQVLAFFCCMTGATLITRPSFIFGGAGVQGSTFLGYGFALAAGITNAGNVISSRRLAEAPVPELSGSAFFSSGLLLLVLPFFQAFSEPSWEPVWESPLIAAGLMFALGLVGVSSSFLFTAGSKWLPAAVSSTVNNAAQLTFGYITQWVFFHMAPDRSAAGGAVLMFISVVLVATTRAPPPRQIMRSLSEMSLVSSRSVSFQGPSSPQGSHPGLRDAPDVFSLEAKPDTLTVGNLEGSTPEDSEVQNPDATASASQLPSVDDDELSLASFIATEYAAATPKGNVVRKRATPAGVAEGVAPSPSVFGVVGAVAPAAL